MGKIGTLKKRERKTEVVVCLLNINLLHTFFKFTYLSVVAFGCIIYYYFPLKNKSIV